VPEDVKSEVEGKVAAVRSALQGGDADSIRSAVSELGQSMQKIGEAMYADAGAEGVPGANGEGPSEEGEKPGEEAVEGEYREV
jgi:molecular chaperone DnaK